MTTEPMTLFSPQLAARFDALVERYPLKRSALIPMLLYAQDEIGYLSDAVVAEVAERIGITELEVRNVASYYSMLRFKPAGRYNVQVCTNISCMLRGGYDVYERFQEELGIGHKGVTADGIFSLEEVECIGACCWAPAIQVNYDYHDEISPAHVPGIVAAYRGKAGVPSNGRPAEPVPAERKATIPSNRPLPPARKPAVPTGKSLPQRWKPKPKGKAPNA